MWQQHMRIDFTKMQGAGNDFILIDNRDGRFPETLCPRIAKQLCRRRFSVGADGMMFVERPRGNGDYRMVFYNSDGSPGEMCGNGARCVARYGYEHGLAGETQNIETTAGLVRGRRIDEERYRIRLNDVSVMKLGVKPETEAGAEDGVIFCDYVELGNPGIPHAVVEVPGREMLAPESLRKTAEAIRHSPAFPRGANVNFYFAGDDGTVEELTFERGVEDFTYACGTGTGSVAAVLTKRGRIGEGTVRFHMPGGFLDIEVCKDRQTDKITDLYLTGSAVIVAEGTAIF